MPIRSGNPDRTKSRNRSFLSYFDTIFNGLDFRKIAFMPKALSSLKIFTEPNATSFGARLEETGKFHLQERKGKINTVIIFS